MLRGASHTGAATRACRGRGAVGAWMFGLVLGLTLTGTGNAGAQRLPLDTWVPSTAASDMHYVPSGQTLAPRGWRAGAAFGYAYAPLDAPPRTGDALLLRHRVDVLMWGRLGVTPRFDVSALVPLALYQEANRWQDDTLVPSNAIRAGFGDPTLGLRFLPFVEPVYDTHIILGLGVSLPLASSGAYLGQGSTTLTPALEVARRFGDISTGMVVGYRLQTAKRVLGVTLGDELRVRGGAEMPWDVPGWRQINVALEIAGATAARAPFRHRWSTPLEVLLTGRTHWGVTEVFTTLGVGVIQGRGAPLARLVVGARWNHATTPAVEIDPLDPDGDGRRGLQDACPERPEDLDGFADHDGCPESDNDGDGITDAHDHCPDDPEDHDRFEDHDGCPDHDRDGDGILDRHDVCPQRAEDRDGHADHDGCPDNDNDNDGIPDPADTCADAPEDRDGFQDEDGCPDLDNDGDGVPDHRDACPLRPHPGDRFGTSDGCPPAPSSPNPTSGEPPRDATGPAPPDPRHRVPLDRPKLFGAVLCFERRAQAWTELELVLGSTAEGRAEEGGGWVFVLPAVPPSRGEASKRSDFA